MQVIINTSLILENALVDSIKRNPGKYALGAGLGGLLAYSHFNQPSENPAEQSVKPDINNDQKQEDDSHPYLGAAGLAGAGYLAYRARSPIAKGLKVAVNVSKGAYDVSKGIYGVAKAASPGIKKAYVDGKNEFLGNKESTVPLPPNFNSQQQTAPGAPSNKNNVKVQPKPRAKKTKVNNDTPAITPVASSSPRKKTTGRQAGGR